jgi:hypothetical protein
MIASRKKNFETSLRPTFIRITLIILAGLSITTPAHADPLLIETGMSAGSLWPILFAGLAVESLILWLIIRRTFGEIVTVCILANTVTGFIGFVALLFFRLKGLPVVPVVPLSIMAITLEAAMISLMLAKPPVWRILSGVTLSNTASALIAVGILLPMNIAPPEPGPDADLRLTSAISTVRQAIDEYYNRYGYYPDALTGGCCNHPEGCSDPLIMSGILQSYPENPYARNLRSREFNAMYLLYGIGKPTSEVGLDDPTNAWEAKWFPAMRDDARFGGPDHILLSANGLSDPRVRNTLGSTIYNMNGADCIPGCFFYRSYDFDGDSHADDYILGAYGWPTGRATVAIDIIDAATGEICLRLDSMGQIHAGEPDGLPEPVLVIHVAGADTEQ